MVGSTQRIHPSCDGGISRVFPGISMHKESQTSPKTFAKDVPISANTTSEKQTGLVEDEKKQRRAALAYSAHKVSLLPTERRDEENLTE